MIEKIKHIKNLGIFSNWIASTDLLFNRYNIIYGWNGSGKSTLTRLFYALEKKKCDNQFPEMEFEIQHSNNITVDEKFSSEGTIVKVFNKDFIENNTKFEIGQTESIIYIGDDNTTLKEEIDLKKSEQVEKQNSIRELESSIKSRLSQKDIFFINSGKEIQAFFLNTIFASNIYDKRNAIKIWEAIKAGASLNDFILPERTFEYYIQFIAQGDKKHKIDYVIPEFDSDKADQLYDEVCVITRRNPVIKSIERLKKNPDISVWVQEGYLLHKQHNSLSCEFCNQTLPDDKLNKLSDHFNEEFKKLQEDISNKKIEVEKLLISENNFNLDYFYSDNRMHMSKYIEELNQYKNQINKGLQAYLVLLTEKEKNPLQTAFASSSIGNCIGSYNFQIEEIDSIIKAHNEAVVNYDSLSDQYREKIEMHYVAKKAIAESFQSLLGEIKEIEDEFATNKRLLDELAKEIVAKEILLKNDTIAIESINSNLHKFLGKNEIVLERNVEGGYNLLRNKQKALNLSEGEKTAISLIYFIVKLKENDNDIKKTIIVFDDPISSLDSNHLFNASSFITNNCAEAKQLIILTHNFWFFKLIRDWMQNKNKNRKGKPSVSNFFEIKNGSLQVADKTLVEYHSEYHYVFKKMFQYSENTDNNLDDAFVIANTLRRVLESFSVMKTPHAPSVNAILNIAVDKNIEKYTSEKVYYFLNKYSHLDRIESHENTFENIAGESKQIVFDVLNIIKTIDLDHYASMEKLCYERN